MNTIDKAKYIEAIREQGVEPIVTDTEIKLGGIVVAKVEGDTVTPITGAALMANPIAASVAILARYRCERS